MYATPITPITPIYASFGSFPPATFGGSGIPNNAVAITKVLNNTDTITLALTATARYNNPTVGNDGAGTFSAGAGSNDGLTSPGQSIGPTWNFDLYIGLTDRSQSLYQFNLVYQDITTGQQGTFSFGQPSSATGTAQDSWNLSMGFLSGIGFNPNAGDVYGFQLNALGANGNIIASSAINVDVTGSNDRVPECEFDRRASGPWCRRLDDFPPPAASPGGGEKVNFDSHTKAPAFSRCFFVFAL